MSAHTIWIGAIVFLMGMNKGGFPVGAIALPLLVLIWPGQAEPAKSAVAFMLPLLCVMDIIAVAFYRRHIAWRRLLPLFPGMLGGVLVASLLFVAKDGAVLSVPDRGIKLCIGLLGITFVFYRAFRRWILRRIGTTVEPDWQHGTAYGLAMGVTSTLAHAAGPIMQMYLLPQRLPKMMFAGTMVTFFLILNLVKVVPFALLGRLEISNLQLAARFLPIIPLGVAAGYGLVRIVRPTYYVALIHVVLFGTSCLLIAKGMGWA